MSLSGRAGHAFTVHTMLQGFACHASGVELVAVDRARAHARVKGKRTHEVLLNVDAERLTVACSCAAESMGIVCKHAWAALLEIDRSAGLEAAASIRGLLPVVAIRPAAESKKPEPEKKPAAEEVKVAAPVKASAKVDEKKPKPKKKKRSA